MTTSTFHARSPAAYEAFMGRWSRRLAKPFIEFTGLAKHERLIDVGCGTGSLAFALVEVADIAGVTGVDLSEIYLEDARARNRDARVSFARGDATQLAFPNGAFDRALSLQVLQFVPDADRAVAEMKRVVRKGGVVSAAVWDSYGGMPSQRLFWDAAAQLGLATDRQLAGFYFRAMTRPGELAAAWVRQGLESVEQSSLTVRMDYENFDDYWAPIAAGEAALGKFAGDLDLDKRRMLEATVRAAYLGGLGDGPRSFSATTWVCKGIVA